MAHDADFMRRLVENQRRAAPQPPVMHLIAPIADAVAPRPLPTQIAVGRMPDGTVAIQIATPVGVAIHFLDAASARSVAKDLERSASDLVVPNLVVPGS